MLSDPLHCHSDANHCIGHLPIARWLPLYVVATCCRNYFPLNSAVYVFRDNLKALYFRHDVAEERAPAPQAHGVSRSTSCERTRLTTVKFKGFYRPYPIAQKAMGSSAIFFESTQAT